MKIPFLFCTLLCFAISAASAKEEKEIPLDQCPAPVQVVIQQNVARVQGKLEKVEREKKDNVEFFDVKIAGADGRHRTLKVAIDGKVIEAKEKKAK